MTQFPRTWATGVGAIARAFVKPIGLLNKTVLCSAVLCIKANGMQQCGSKQTIKRCIPWIQPGTVLDSMLTSVRCSAFRDGPHYPLLVHFFHNMGLIHTLSGCLFFFKWTSLLTRGKKDKWPGLYVGGEGVGCNSRWRGTDEKLCIAKMKNLVPSLSKFDLTLFTQHII